MTAPTQRTSTRSRLALAGLFVAAVAWSVTLAAVFHVPGRTGQDPYGYFDLARSLSLGHGFGYDYPWQEPGHPIRPGFAPGYPALLAVVFALFGAHETPARALTFALAAACPALAFVALRALLRPHLPEPRAARAALSSAALLAVCGLYARVSLAVMSDAMALAALLAAAATGVALARAPEPSPARGALLALFCSVAVATRYASIPISLVISLATLASIARRERARALSTFAAFALTAGLGAAALALVLPPATLTAHPVGGGWSPRNALASSAPTPDGRLEWHGPLALVYALDLLRPGITVLGLCFASAAGIALGPRAPVLLALAWIASSMALLVGVPQHNARYLFLTLPAFTALAALALDRLSARAFRLALGALLVAGALGSAREARRMGQQAARERALLGLVSRVQREDRSPLRVFTLGFSPPLYAHVERLEVWESFVAGDARWDAALARPGRCLVVVEAGAERQWSRLPAWPRMLRALARPVLRRLRAGTVLALEVECGPLTAPPLAAPAAE